MLSFHAASIMASCVRTEYPSQSGAQDIPMRSPRIRGPDNENNVDRLCAAIVPVELLTGRTRRVRGFASVPMPPVRLHRPFPDQEIMARPWLCLQIPQGCWVHENQVPMCLF
jgi:hypothetical protein